MPRVPTLRGRKRSSPDQAGKASVSDRSHNSSGRKTVLTSADGLFARGPTATLPRSTSGETVSACVHVSFSLIGRVPRG